MSTEHFRITRHIAPASHIRQYYQATSDPLDELKLAVKQYTPLDNPNPQPGDVTILAAHANGVGKELYEPLFDDIWEEGKKAGTFKIRNIWIADVAWQGESSVINEEKLGADPSWFDHPRDLLNLVNHFRREMIPPLFGMGHSMGGNQVTNLSLMHPRLLDGLILIDPVILERASAGGNFIPTYMSTLRRDIWPSRQEAEQSFRKNAFYKKWDERVLQKHIQYSLRNLPTAVYPEAPTAATPSDGPVTLTTTKHQEVFTFSRHMYPANTTFNSSAYAEISNYIAPRSTHPDVPDSMRGYPVYRPEPAITFHNLWYLRPRCMYIFASESDLSSPRTIAEKLRVTGKGVGGNGGKGVDGAVTDVTLQGAGHFVPFERPREVAHHVTEWLGKEMGRWRREVEVERLEWEKVKRRDGGRGRYVMSEEFTGWVKGFTEESGMVAVKGKKGKTKKEEDGKARL